MASANRTSHVANRFKKLLPTTYNLQPNLGFTLVEMLVVIAMIAILAVVTFASYNIPKTLEQSRYAATVEGLHNIATAAKMYANDKDKWAADVNRSIPSAFSTYISPASWAKGPFTNSVWDWDNWQNQTCWDGSTGIIQITLRQVNNYKGNNDYTIYYVIKGVGIPHCSTASTKGECINCVSRYP